jgi:hypothetical protein
MKGEIEDALKMFFESDKGETLLGNIVMKAMNQALEREIEFEDGSTEPGRIVVKKETWNVLDFLVKYIPRIEGSIRGCQSDAGQARNRSSESLEILTSIGRMMDERLEIPTIKLLPASKE